MGHGQVGTEHLLLGLIAEETGAAGRAFAQLGVTLDAARDAVMALVRPGERRRRPSRSRSARGRKGTLEASLRQAMGLKDTVIGTEHILLALLIERDGRTASVFASLALPARPAAHDGDRAARRVGARPTRTTTARRCSCCAEGSGVAATGAGARSASRPQALRDGDRAGALRLVTRSARGGT